MDADAPVAPITALGVQVGDNNTQHNVMIAQPRTDWPRRVGSVPPLADCWQHRAPFDELHAAAGPGRDRPCGQVLTGLGGTGKTQLAAALAQHAWRDGEVDLLVWVTAESRASIVATYALAAREVAQGDTVQAEAGAQLFLAWLAGTSRRWLIVLDDLTDPADLRGLWPPDTASGHTIVTSRRRDTALTAGRRIVPVGLFTPDDARMYLQQKLAGSTRLLVEADDLAADLGYLPLALAQAAAYLCDRDLTCAQYRVRFADERRRLADLFPEPGAVPDDYRHTIAVTWSISIELADGLHPKGLARPLLEVAALLDPNGIPLEIFTGPGLAAHLTDGRTDSPAGFAGDDVRDALHALHRLSLATVDRDSNMLRVHALVQRAVREATPAAHAPARAAAAADALLAGWPEFDVDWERARALQGCALALRESARTSLDRTHPVMFRVAHSLGTTLQAIKAVDFLTSLLELDEAAPIDNGDALAMCINLAYWSGRYDNRVENAIATVRVCAVFVDECRQLLGPGDLRTLAAQNNQAHWMGRAGDISGAVELLTRLVDEMDEWNTTDRDLVLAAYANLVFWRGKATGSADVADTLEPLLVLCGDLVGYDHAIAQVVRGNLAHAWAVTGDPARAVQVAEPLAEIRARLFGPDHRETLAARALVAEWRGRAGDARGARRDFERLLEDHRRIGGAHDDTAFEIATHLATWQAESGDPEGAIDRLEREIAQHHAADSSQYALQLARYNLTYWKDKVANAAGDRRDVRKDCVTGWKLASLVRERLAAGNSLATFPAIVDCRPGEVQHGSLMAVVQFFHSQTIEYTTYGLAIDGLRSGQLTIALADALADVNVRNAFALAEVQWRRGGLAPVVLTNQRLLVRHDGEWLTWPLWDLVSMAPLMDSWSLVLSFENVPPMMLTGPATPWLTAALSTLKFVRPWPNGHHPPWSGEMPEPLADNWRDPTILRHYTI